MRNQTLYINYDNQTDTHEIKLDDVVLLRGEYMYCSNAEDVLSALGELLGLEVVEGEYELEFEPRLSSHQE